ncbi:MAG: hypothetical protein WCR42_05260 [bacterium]
MKTKLFIMLALVLTMFAVNAKAQNPFANACAPGSTETTVPLSICGVSAQVKVCYLCPTFPPQENFSLNVIEVTFTGTPIPGCDLHAEITKVICNWSYIQANFCPGWTVPEPCINGIYSYKVNCVWPLCMHMHLNLDNTVTSHICEPECCWCVTTWKYCYQNGVLNQIIDSQNIVPNPYAPSSCSGVTCSTQCPTPYYSPTCWPTPLNPNPPCYKTCY